jgi:hypothetical protein
MRSVANPWTLSALTQVAGGHQQEMGDDASAHNDEAPLAPLLGLVDRLRGEVTELQGRWEALGEELEAKRRRLKLAEATVELLQRRGEEEEAIQEGENHDADVNKEGAEGGGALDTEEEEEHVSQAAQASAGNQMEHMSPGTGCRLL